MIYRILFYFANIVIRIYYRKIHVTGLESIPKNKPLIIVSNHPNGFLEPIIMACLFPIELHFLVRGDLFEKKALRWLLTSTNQVPIYRFKDGIAALRNNQKTIAKTLEVLNRNKAIIIFAEGSTDSSWFLREFKKGMARMAFQCLDENPNLDLQILPVGVVFQKSSSPGTEVMLNVGEAFAVNPYYVKNAREAKDKMDALTLDTYNKIKKLVIHIEDDSHTSLVHKAWKLYSSRHHDWFLPRVTHDQDIFSYVKKSISSSNEVPPLKNGKYFILNLFSFILGIPGFIFWILPVYFGEKITKQFVKEEEFVSSIKASSTAGLCVIYSIVLLIPMIYFLGISKAFLLLIAFSISGIFMLAAWEYKQC
ncbi:MAG: hypothetical protein RLZZ546_142 [Bacteroidota bacterium]|jgi:1-acyl-sn-glycerol-3-phosphate acyltransferase